MAKCDRNQCSGIQLTLSIVGLTCFFTYPASAQITPDHSLGSENSMVTPNATVKEALADLISGGAIRGNNLFHSFEQFNVKDGSRVYFANPDGIANILTRVTGNNLSEIFGTLGVDGAANLFLLNPNGIVFGENAALDVNGSFLATTADSYIFNNGFAYSASDPETPPLLTVNIPAGLQFGNNPASLQVQRSTLAVKPNQTLALLGGDVQVDRGKILVPGGTIELGSLSESGIIELEDESKSFSFPVNVAKGNIDLAKNTLIDVRVIAKSGQSPITKSGRIQLNTGSLSLVGGSRIQSITDAPVASSDILINANGEINISGFSEDGLFSGILTHSATDNSGGGGNIVINNPTGNLNLRDRGFIATVTDSTNNGGSITANLQNLTAENGGQITTATTNIGNAGDITINANDTVRLAGESEDFLSDLYQEVLNPNYRPQSGLVSESRGVGNGGKVTINAGQIILENSGTISNDTFDAGNGGNISLNANSLLKINGANISSAIHNSGNGGNLSLDAQQIEILNDSQLIFDVLAPGKTGNISLKATDSILIDNSSLANHVDYEGSGNAGNISVDTKLLTLTDFSRIVSGTFDAGDSGNIDVNADQLEIDNSEIGAYSVSSGNAGQINIEADNLLAKNGGSISAVTWGSGNGGDLSIKATNIELTGQATEGYYEGSSSGLFAYTIGSGIGGDISVEAEELIVKDNSEIDASTFGQANAGNIAIDVQRLKVENAGIFALSNGDFNAGSININADTLNISDLGFISVSNLGNGNSGNLNVTANQLNLDNFATLEAEVNSGNQGNINLTTDNIFLRNQSEITTTASRTSIGGNITIYNTENIVLLDNSQILAEAEAGNGGNINITTVGLFVSPDSLIDASSEFGLDGTVEIDEINSDRQLESNRLSENTVDSTNLITTSCSNSDKNSFAVTGNGGIPHSPYSTQSLNATWYDLRSVREVKTNLVSLATPLTEANTTIINSNGELELVALTPLSNYRWVKSSCGN